MWWLRDELPHYKDCSFITWAVNEIYKENNYKQEKLRLTILRSVEM